MDKFDYFCVSYQAKGVCSKLELAFDSAHREDNNLISKSF